LGRWIWGNIEKRGEIGYTIYTEYTGKKVIAVEIAKVTSNGQITIPSDIRRRLSIKDGDKVLFMESDAGVLMFNSSMVALRQFQKDMEGEAGNVGLLTEDDVVALWREVRKDLSGGRNAGNA
jgi:AbrB family looped-hinge helix DNA binding protein